MVFFLQISVEEGEVLELVPAFSGRRRAFLQAADQGHAKGSHDEIPVSAFRPLSPSSPCEYAQLKLPQIQIQPPTPPRNAPISTSTLPPMSTLTSEPEHLSNGSSTSQPIPHRIHDMNGCAEKKQSSSPTTEPDTTMTESRSSDEYSSEDGIRTRSPTDVNNQSRPRHARKSSIPLAPPFMVSAPGKVIVYGEHAVVHGKAALAAAISLRSYLHVSTLTKSSRTVSLFFPDIALSHTWSIDALPWSAFQHPSKKRTYYDLVTTLDRDLLASLAPHIDRISAASPPHTRKIHHHTATAFLYLFLSLGSPRRSLSCIYTLRSTLPPGAGLGSSASVSVCLSTALLLQAHALAGPHPDQPGSEAALQLERVNRWAFVAECCIHGNPSGIDNTVATRGRAVVFQRTDYARPPDVRDLAAFPTLPLWLVNTRQLRTTAAEVAKVARLRERWPAIANGVLDAIDRVTHAAVEVIERVGAGDGAGQKGVGVGEEALRQLGELMALNHGLLVALGVSHPKLEKLRALVEGAGVGWTKLTGAGGGGCAITLLNPRAMAAADGKGEDVDTPVAEKNKADEQGLENGNAEGKLERLERELEDEGFEKFEATLGGDGVGVLWPAVLQNGSEESEEGGEEIDQEKFLRVKGREGLEKLVGVLGPERGVREGWRFWTV